VACGFKYLSIKSLGDGSHVIACMSSLMGGDPINRKSISKPTVIVDVTWGQVLSTQGSRIHIFGWPNLLKNQVEIG
jgi:hypothetical protein